MGKYINKLPDGTILPAHGKADKLLTIPGALETNGAPSEWKDNIVCVVNNGPFEAAGYAFDEQELKVFARPDGRPKRWLLIPNAKDIAQ